MQSRRTTSAAELRGRKCWLKKNNKLQFFFCCHPLCPPGSFAQPCNEQNKSLRGLTCICLIEMQQSQISAGFDLWRKSESHLFIYWTGLIFRVWLFLSFCESHIRVAVLGGFISGEVVFSCSNEFLVRTSSWNFSLHLVLSNCQDLAFCLGQLQRT